MSQRIAPSGDLAREALSAARAQLERSARSMGSSNTPVADSNATFEAQVRDLLGERAQESNTASKSEAASGTSFTSALTEGIEAVQQAEESREVALKEVLTGELNSLPELAARVRRADLTLKYSMEIRNRLIDAYREVMRMSV